MINVDDLEKFLGGPTPSPFDRLYVTINKENVIGLNMNAYKKLGRPEAVFLHYSRSKMIIVIEPASVRMPAAFPVKKKTHVGWRINASPFCKHFGIRIDSTERFINPDLEHEGRRLVLRLKETVTIKQLRRKKKAE
ncbi:MAG: hypothetical protein PSX80_00975 [bacterium]|nr:hypothetical protein [bacterium]